MMREAVILLCLLVGALARSKPQQDLVGASKAAKTGDGCGCAGCADDDAETLRHAAKIEQLTADLVNAEDEVSRDVEHTNYVHAELVDIITRVDTLSGSGCDDRFEFQCGGNSPKCLSRLMICDEIEDCPNGADETQCRVFTPTGSDWRANVIWDHCTKFRPDSFDLHIDEYKIIPYLKPFPEITASYTANKDVGDYDVTQADIIHGWMDLKPGNHILYFHPPETNGIAKACTFDGVNDDHCHGEFIHEGSFEVCGEFYMQRTDN